MKSREKKLKRKHARLRNRRELERAYKNWPKKYEKLYYILDEKTNKFLTHDHDHSLKIFTYTSFIYFLRNNGHKGAFKPIKIKNK